MISAMDSARPNSRDRAVRAIRTWAGARVPNRLRFAFAKIACDGYIVFLPGLGGKRLRAQAYVQL